MDKAKSIQLLNKGVGDELQAIHQYIYFHFHLADQGFNPLAMLFKQTAIMEMTHLELLAERILFLKGDVEMVPTAPVQKIHEPEAMLAKAMEMENAAAAFYNQAVAESSANADSVSKQLFEQLVGAEENHFDAYEKQKEHINRFGPSYLALQSFGQSPEGGGTGGAAPAQ